MDLPMSHDTYTIVCPFHFGPTANRPLEMEFLIYACRLSHSIKMYPNLTQNKKKCSNTMSFPYN